MSHSSRRGWTLGVFERVYYKVVSREAILGALSLFLILAFWEVGSRTMIFDPRFFPPPTEVAMGFMEMYSSGEFLGHFWVSIRRIVLAFLIGSAVGIVTGILMGWSPIIGSMLDPYISILYPIPKIVILPIFFILMGVGEPARIATIGLAVFLLVSINTMAGVQQIDESLLLAAEDNGASGLSLFREVIIPGALKQIFTGLSLGIGITFILLVLVEMVGADNGLGYIIWDSWEQFRVVRMYVAILTINVLGIVCVYGLETLGDIVTPWE